MGFAIARITIDKIDVTVISQHKVSVVSETHKELKRVTRVHSARIFSFAKYHIWKHKDFVRE